MSYSYEVSPYMSDASAQALLGFVLGVLALSFALVIIIFIAQWKIFIKMGMPGWYGIVPWFNTWKMFEYTWGHGAYMFLLFIPFVNFIIAFIYAVKLAKRFGYGAGFGIFMLGLLAPIGFCILAFGGSEYVPLE